jgi:hypothetical protein
MHYFFPHEPGPGARFRATIRQAQPALGLRPPARSFASGFGAVLEQESDLQASTEGYLGTVDGPHSAATDRILRDQQIRLGANVSLLEQRYDMLPASARFRGLRGRLRPPAKARRVTMESIDALRHLVAEHLGLMENLELLMGKRGEHLLAEVAHNHEEMAWMLTALLKEDQSVRDQVAIPMVARRPVPAPLTATEGNWENEGGALRGPASA